jgi:hypothetical protein
VVDTISAAVTGARHQREARNGQDAAATWKQGPVAIAVVCDGCSSGASSEVGARLGASLFTRALAVRLLGGQSVLNATTWDGARADVAGALSQLVDRLAGDRDRVIHDHALFTIVAAAVSGNDAAVWALGDGAYSFGDTTHVLGPFENNAPPYLAYDLQGEARPAHFAVAPRCDVIAVATDGAAELVDGLEPFTAARFVDHPDALRRRLAVLARAAERIDWAERRVVRTPAMLQDDCAIAILRRSAPRSES